MYTNPTSDHNSISYVVTSDRCVGCGVCAFLCPVNAIQLVKSYNHLAIVENDDCISCKRCLDVCPAEDKNSNGENLDSVRSLIGNYNEVLLAGSTSQKLQLSGSSGGVVTALLISAFEEKAIDGALIIGDDYTFPQYSLATTSNQIINGAGSKYFMAPLEKPLRELAKLNGRYAVVALPCQIKALRRLIELDPSMKNKLVLLIGLFCGRGVDLNAVNLLKKITGTSGNITSFVRKGRSTILVFVEEENHISEYTVPFEKWAKYTLPSFFFTPPACFHCSDHTAEEADVSFGDAWHVETENEKSIVVVRTKIGESFLRNAVRSNAVRTKRVSPLLLIYSQSSQLYFHKVITRIVNRPWSSYQNSKIFSILCTIAILTSNTFYKLLRDKSHAIPLGFARLTGLMISFLKRTAANKFMNELINI